MLALSITNLHDSGGIFQVVIAVVGLPASEGLHPGVLELQGEDVPGGDLDPVDVDIVHEALHLVVELMRLSKVGPVDFTLRSRSTKVSSFYLPAQIFHKEVHLARCCARRPRHCELVVAVGPGTKLVQVRDGEEGAVDLLSLDHELQEVPDVSPNEDGAPLRLE